MQQTATKPRSDEATKDPESERGTGYQPVIPTALQAAADRWWADLPKNSRRWWRRAIARQRQAQGQAGALEATPLECFLLCTSVARRAARRDPDTLRILNRNIAITAAYLDRLRRLRDEQLGRAMELAQAADPTDPNGGYERILDAMDSQIEQVEQTEERRAPAGFVDNDWDGHG
jgi:hypothetical protein